MPRASEGRERTKACGVKLGRNPKLRRNPKLTGRQKREAIAARDYGGETRAEIGRSCNVSGRTISKFVTGSESIGNLHRQLLGEAADLRRINWPAEQKEL